MDFNEMAKCLKVPEIIALLTDKMDTLEPATRERVERHIKICPFCPNEIEIAKKCGEDFENKHVILSIHKKMASSDMESIKPILASHLREFRHCLKIVMSLNRFVEDGIEPDLGGTLDQMAKEYAEEAFVRTRIRASRIKFFMEMLTGIGSGNLVNRG